MAKAKLFEYAVIFHPRGKKETEEAEGESVLITDVTRVLATGPDVVGIMAAQSIRAEYAKKLDQVEIVVRPF